MTNTMDSVRPYHDAYQQGTGLQVMLTLPRIYAWQAWMLHGWTVDDLKNTIRHIKGKIKAGQKTMAALKFSNLIERVEWMEEELAEFKAMSRIPKPHPAAHLTPRAKAVTTRETPAVHVGDVLAGLKAFEQFKALKGQL